jgi:hypothetical protein
LDIDIYYNCVWISVSRYDKQGWKMKNEHAALDSGLTATLLFLIISLTFSATAITWFLFQIYGISVAGINLPTSQTSQNINYLSDNSTDSVIMKNGDWLYTGNGRVSTVADSYLIFNNIGYSDGTNYVNEYIIDNKNLDYGIIIVYNSEGCLEVIAKDDGFYLHNSWAL